jgi:hypothetical protein
MRLYFFSARLHRATKRNVRETLWPQAFSVMMFECSSKISFHDFAIWRACFWDRVYTRFDVLVIRCSQNFLMACPILLVCSFDARSINVQRFYSELERCKSRRVYWVYLLYIFLGCNKSVRRSKNSWIALLLANINVNIIGDYHGADGTIYHVRSLYIRERREM